MEREYSTSNRSETCWFRLSSVRTGNRAGVGQEMFRISMPAMQNETGVRRFPYDVSPDGKRILITEPVDPEEIKPQAVPYIVNSQALLKQR